MRWTPVVGFFFLNAGIFGEALRACEIRESAED